MKIFFEDFCSFLEDLLDATMAELTRMLHSLAWFYHISFDTYKTMVK